MEEADALCDRVAIVDHGKVIALGTPPELKRSVPGGYIIRLQVSPRPPALLRQLERLAGRHRGRARRASSAWTSTPTAAARSCRRSSTSRSSPRVEIRDVHISEPSLENLFLHHTGRSLRD